MSDDLSLEPLDEGLRTLLRAEAARPGPEPDVAVRMLARLEATLGLPPLPTGGGGAPPAAPAGGGAALTTAGAASKWVVSAALVGAGMVAGAGLHATLAPPPAPRVEVVTKTVEVHVPVPVPAPAVAPPPTVEAPAAPVVQETSRARHVDASRDRALEQENALVSRAQSAVARREPRLALEALEEHARRFPAGQFAEEREALWVQALVMSGDVKAAAQRAQRFKARHPRSVLMPAIDAALRGGP